MAGRWVGMCKGLLFGLLFFLTAFFNTLVAGVPLFLVSVVSPSVGRRALDVFIGFWFVFCVALFELLLGIKIVIHGHPAPTTDSTLILCNHRTRLDWLFLMAYQLRCGSLSHYRISLKQSLKNLPVPGWGMQLAGYVFLQRDWSQDQQRITRSLQYFAQTRTRPQFLLFPEGTDLNPNGLVKSRAFAEKHGLPVYKHVLHPRTTGFVHFVKEMRKNKILDSILDLTVAYPRDVIQNEADLVLGRFPQEVHFLALRHPIADVPSSAERLENWCRDLWRRKESTLEKFYNQDRTFSKNRLGPVVSPATEAWL
nr:hypothetical protein BaRGS_022127 [Batillaria attramentaria]